MSERLALQDEAVHQLCNRLRRVEGQARGLVSMIEEGRSCSEIAVQMAALKAAINKSAMAFVAAYFERCLGEVEGEEAAQALRRVGEMFLRLA